jgi:hypothetical protein
MPSDVGLKFRAFQLASEGNCKSISDIRAALYCEGFDDAARELSDAIIRSQPRDAMPKKITRNNVLFG